MTALDQYLFDLHGYIAVEDVLGDDQLARLNRLVDDGLAALDDPQCSTHRFKRVMNWDPLFMDLLDNDRIRPYLDALVGKLFRLDHAYLDVIREGFSPIGATLHGGGTPHHPGMFYRFHNGRMYNGLTVVAYNLRDVNPGDGGFGCVPGSHKSNMPFPKEWTDLTKPEQCVRAVTGPAGSAVIFTEALTHGALPWTGRGDRRTIFFKYNHTAISWSGNYVCAEDFDGLTERQKRILSPPRDEWAAGRTPNS